MTRALLIDDRARAEVARVLAWAKDHHLDNANPTFIPGLDPKFTVLLDHGFKAVFTYTILGDDLFRHLSVSVPGPGDRYPNPIALWMIASLFGFTGWTEEMGVTPAKSWQLQIREHSAQVLEKVTS